MPTDPVENLAFLISSDTGVVPRALSAWASDYALSVRSFGALGNSIHDDTANIQACFNAAFGSSGSPHGINSSLNRPVFCPPGEYMCGDLTLTQVKGGLIYGAGAGTTLHYNGTPGANKAIITANGFESSRIQGMGFIGSGAAPLVIGLDLDMTNPISPVGLRNNVLTELGASSIHTVVRIGNSGNQGYGNYILQVFGDNCSRILKINSSGGSNTLVAIGASECNAGNLTGFFRGVPPTGAFGYGIECTGGDIVQFNLGGAGNQTDMLWSSSGTLVVVGGRSESLGILEINNGRAILMGVGYDVDEQDQPPGGSDWIPLGYMRTIKMVSPAEVIYDGSFSSPAGVVEGTGTLYIRGGSSFADPRAFSSFTGQIREFLSVAPLTMSQLTFAAAEGCEVNVSNCNVSGGWGTVVTSASTGANHAKLRWNNSAWTIVGK